MSQIQSGVGYYIKNAQTGQFLVYDHYDASAVQLRDYDTTRYPDGYYRFYFESDNGNYRIYQVSRGEKTYLTCGTGAPNDNDPVKFIPETLANGYNVTWTTNTNETDTAIPIGQTVASNNNYGLVLDIDGNNKINSYLVVYNGDDWGNNSNQQWYVQENP